MATFLKVTAGNRIIHINPDHVVSFEGRPDNGTTVMLTVGNPLAIEEAVDDFLKSLAKSRMT